MKNAKAYSYQGNGCYMGGLSLEPTDDSVFSVCSSSTVTTVFDLGNERVVVTKDSLERFYVYTGFREVFFSKGNTINKGELIGLLAKEKMSDFIFLVSNNKGTYLSADKTWELIKDDSCNSVQVSDTTMSP